MIGSLVLKNSSKYDKFLINGKQLLGRRHGVRNGGHMDEMSVEHDSYLNSVYSRVFFCLQKVDIVHIVRTLQFSKS